MPPPKPVRPWYRPRNIILLVLLLFISFVGFQVYRALTMRPGSSVNFGQRLNDLTIKTIPGVAEANNGLETLADAIARSQAAIQQLEASDPEFRQQAIDFTLIGAVFDPANPGATGNAAGTQADFDQRLAMTTAVLQNYRGHGVFTKLQELRTKKGLLRPVHQGKLIDVILPEINEARHLARANCARFRQAIAGKDEPQAIESFEQNLVLANMISSEPFVISAIIGVSIRDESLGELRGAMLAGSLTPSTLEAIAGALERHSNLLPISYSFEGERASTLDIIQWTHTDNGSGDGRRIVVEVEKFRELSQFSTGKQPSPLINLASMMYPRKKHMEAKANVYYDAMVKYVDVAPRDRKAMLDPANLRPPPTWEYNLFDMCLPALGHIIKTCDDGRQNLLGMHIMVAIERYRLKNGALPPTLEALVPEFLSKLPDDGFAADGKFRYTILPKPDTHGRTYLLYSVGSDGNDNRGNENPASPAAPGQATFILDTDIVINRAEPRGGSRR